MKLTSSLSHPSLGEDTSSHYPSQAQQLLILAIILRGKKALTAWEGWSRTVDFEALEEDSSHVLPQLYRNLQKLGVEEFRLRKLKGIYRHAWCQNQFKFQDLIKLLSVLRKGGTSFVVLGDMSMAVSVYQDLRSSVIRDLHILVPHTQAKASINLLHGLGWSSGWPIPERAIPRRNFLSFTNGPGHQCFLHWHYLNKEFAGPEEDELWDEVKAVEFEGIDIPVFNPTFQLIEFLIDKAFWSRVPSSRWLVDIAILLTNNHSSPDWNRLLQECRDRIYLMPLKENLRFIIKGLPMIPLPIAMMQQLQDERITKFEELEYAAVVNPVESQQGLLARIAIHWCAYLRLDRRKAFLKNLSGFVMYLKQKWGIAHLWKVPIYGIIKGMKRVWNVGFV